MAGKTPKKQNKSIEASVAKRQKASQMMLAVFAIVLIISMVLSAVTTY
ncbi:MAG: hypothetical protein H6635_14820 [Anaerolineales bacterium]|nr:hypothetical protein [Anaerolineales bacterium]MCB9146636.1 hypothetical protein [Anaerolineales bacterium]